jgi:hypothetical protein
MQAEIIHRFQALATYCYDMYLAEDTAQLGIVYRSSPLAAPDENGMYLALFDLARQECTTLVAWSATGPGPRDEKYVVSDVLLRYDAERKRWVIAQLHNGHYVALRTLAIEAPDQPVLSPLCLVDQEEDFERGFNPLLDLQMTKNTYRLFVHKASPGHMSAPGVNRVEIALGGPAWSALREPWVDVVTGKEPPPFPPHNEQVVVPEEATFDPYLPDASWNSAARLVENEQLATAENAMMFRSSSADYLVLASPQQWVSARNWQFSLPDNEAGEWKTWITHWNEQWTELRWDFASQIALPGEEALPAYEYPTWPLIHVALCAGPARDGTTLAAIVSMRNEEDEQLLSQGVFLEQATGKLLQSCQAPFGLYPSLCCCGETLVGVDLFNGEWRVWQWPVLQQADLARQKTLATSCTSAYVYRMPANEEEFWLLEDRTEGTVISRYDARTLHETAPALLLPAVHMLYTQQEERPLNGYRSPGLVAYGDCFLLLLRAADDEMLFYQVR